MRHKKAARGKKECEGTSEKGGFAGKIGDQANFNNGEGQGNGKAHQPRQKRGVSTWGIVSKKKAKTEEVNINPSENRQSSVGEP